MHVERIVLGKSRVVHLGTTKNQSHINKAHARQNQRMGFECATIQDASTLEDSSRSHPLDGVHDWLLGPQ